MSASRSIMRTPRHTCQRGLSRNWLQRKLVFGIFRFCRIINLWTRVLPACIVSAPQCDWRVSHLEALWTAQRRQIWKYNKNISSLARYNSFNDCNNKSPEPKSKNENKFFRLEKLFIFFFVFISRKMSSERKKEIFERQGKVKGVLPSATCIDNCGSRSIMVTNPTKSNINNPEPRNEIAARWNISITNIKFNKSFETLFSDLKNFFRILLFSPAQAESVS